MNTFAMSSQKESSSMTKSVTQGDKSVPAESQIQKERETEKSPLVAAILDNDSKLVQQLLRNENVLHFETSSTMSPLHYASQSGNMEIVELLFNSGYNKIQTEANNKTPLHLAVENGHIAVVKYLIANGFKESVSTPKNHCLIRKCTLDDRLEFLQCLITANDATGINEEDSNSKTLLHSAALHGRIEILRYLIECGADAHAKTDENEIPLHYAIKSGHVDIVLELVNLNYDFLFKNLAMHVAAENGNEEIFKILLEAEYPTNDFIKDKAPIHVAAEFGNWKLIDMLLKTGVDINLSTKIYEKTPLYFAVYSEQLTTVQFLLQSGAHPVKPNKDWNNPLKYILRNPKIPWSFIIKRQIKILRCLLNYLPESDVVCCLHSVIGYYALNGSIIDTASELYDVLLEYNSKQEYETTQCVVGGCLKNFVALVVHTVSVKTLVKLLMNSILKSDYIFYLKDNNYKFFYELLVARIVVLNSLSPDCKIEKKFELKDPFGLKNHYEECHRQMIKMRETKIDEASDISFYDVLVKPVNKVANYLKCKKLIVNLESSYNTFPAYAILLEKSVENCKDRQILINASVNVLSNVIQKEFKIHLPSEMIMKIFEYLDAIHLRKLIAAYYDPNFQSLLCKEKMS